MQITEPDRASIRELKKRTEAIGQAVLQIAEMQRTTLEWVTTPWYKRMWLKLRRTGGRKRG